MKKPITILLLITVFLLAGCQKAELAPSNDNSNSDLPSSDIDTNPPADRSQLFSDRDFEVKYDESQCTAIGLHDSTATGSGITVSGSIITISEEGSYILSGELTDGMIIVDSDKQSKIQLILDNASIHSTTSAPIYIKQADKVFITLADGSKNFLSSGNSYVAIDENNIDAAIFSKDDLTLNGSGSLTVYSPAGHGIVSKDDLRITGGNYTVTAAGHGFTGQDALSIADGNFLIECGKDGLHAENKEDPTLGCIYIENGTYQITSDGDAISATGTVYLTDGTYHLLCGGGSEYGEEHTDDMFGGMGGRPGGMGGRGFRAMPETTEESDATVSAKGLKSTGSMLITGGNYSINSADDAVHSNNVCQISGGAFQIATGDDGFHADESLNISSGTIRISESYEGLEGLTITISGGDISLKASDDGLNAAGGNDQSGFGGMPGGMGKRPGGMGGFGGDHFGSSSDSFIEISGGQIFIDADGDGIDSNGNLTFSGGYTVVEGPTNGGNGPLDYGGAGSLSGGTIIISGSSGMAQSLTSTGTQGVLAINVGSCSAGTSVVFSDLENNEIFSLTPTKNFGCVIVSSEDIIKGESYRITLGDQIETFDAQ